MTVYKRTVPTDALPEIRAFVAKLNKRAAKVGVPALVLAEGPVYTRKRRDAFGRNRTYELCDCELAMAAPIKFAGYSFVAKLETLGDEVLIAAMPGQEVPAHYRDPAKTCDHCRKDRIRKAYYLVRDDTGTYLRVGSSCLKDFLGTDAAGALFAGDLPSRLGEEFDDEEKWFGKAEPLYNTPMILALTAGVIRLHGWVSKKAATETLDGPEATVVRVSEQFSPNLEPKRRIKVTEPDRRMAQQALAWAKEKFNGDPAKRLGLSDYEHNLRLVSNMPAVRYRHLGLLCSLVPTAQRALNQQAERAQATATVKALPNGHIGKVGERRQFAGKVIGMHSFNSDWGVTHYCRVATPEGLVVVRSTKPWWADSVDRGSEVKFLATVKKHGAYKGNLETVVNRAVQQ